MSITEYHNHLHWYSQLWQRFLWLGPVEPRGGVNIACSKKLEKVSIKAGFLPSLLPWWFCFICLTSLTLTSEFLVQWGTIQTLKVRCLGLRCRHGMECLWLGLFSLSPETKDCHVIVTIELIFYVYRWRRSSFMESLHHHVSILARRKPNTGPREGRSRFPRL